VLVCVALAGCHSNMQNEDAVKRGVMDYLSTRQGLNVASMNVAVASMVFRQNEVDATVTFSPRDSGSAQPLSIHYLLERKGDRWVVKPRVDAGQSPHGMGANPHAGGMPVPQGGRPTGALPPGHPAVPPQDSNPR
jgi:hypothetical protein